MKRIVLIAGVPGVGKSTLAHTIARLAGGSVLDVDDFKRQVVDPTLLAEQIDPPEVRSRYYAATLEEAFRIFGTETVSLVVIDEVFHVRALRQEIASACSEKNVEVLWVEVRCAYDLVERRLQVRSRDGHILSSEKALEMYRQFLAIFEGFGLDENHILLHSEVLPPEELARQVLAKMR